MNYNTIFKVKGVRKQLSEGIEPMRLSKFFADPVNTKLSVDELHAIRRFVNSLSWELTTIINTKLLG